MSSAPGALQGLIALGSSPAQISPPEAERVALEVYGIRGRATVLSGERDCNFRLDAGERACVLKFIDPSASDCIVAGQSAVLRHLADGPCAVDLPRPIASLAGDDVARTATTAGSCRVRLLSWLSGEPLATLHPPAVLLHEIGRQVGELDLALRSFSHPALHQAIAWDVRQLPVLSVLVPGIGCAGVRRLLQDCLPGILSRLPEFGRLRSQALHADCHPGNLLVDAARTRCSGIIDLGDLIHGPLILEIAVTLAESLAVGLASEEDLLQLLSGFAHVQGFEPRECELLFHLVTARLAVMILIQSWRATAELSAPPQSLPPDHETPAVLALERLQQRGSHWWTLRFERAVKDAIDARH